MRRPLRVLVTWIATLALLLASLAPALAQAGAGPARWAEICTGTGTTLVAFHDDRDDRGDPARPQPAAHVLEHCPYCSLHADTLALPPALPVLPAALPPGPLLPAAFLHADETLDVWASAPARAPPTGIHAA